MPHRTDNLPAGPYDRYDGGRLTVDMNWYGCECGCGELFRASQLEECPECLKSISKDCMEYHKC